MPITYQPMRDPLRLLIRNDLDTAWQVGGCFDDYAELIDYIRESKISPARKRIVHATMTSQREHGLHRYRFTTIWEGTRLPAGIGASHTVEDAEYPHDYDTR